MKYIELTPESIAKLKEQLPPEPTQVDPKPTQKKDYLTILMEGIRDFEGWSQGSRSFRNNNPGNTRYSSVGYATIYGTVLKDKDNFAVFKDYETGWLYLKNLLIHKATLHPEWNLVSLMKEYAPSSDNNNPIGYATYLGKRLDVNPHLFQLKSLLT